MNSAMPKTSAVSTHGMRRKARAWRPSSSIRISRSGGGRILSPQVSTGVTALGRSDLGPVDITVRARHRSGSQRSVQQAPLTALDHGFGAVAHAEGLKEEGYVLFHGVFRKAQFPRDELRRQSPAQAMEYLPLPGGERRSFRLVVDGVDDLLGKIHRSLQY